MQPATQKEKMNLSHAKALRRAREMMKVTRIEMARRLNLSIEAIKKYEKGGSIIDEKKIQNYLQALHLTDEDYQKIKRGKGIGINKKQRIVFSNSDRRSYKRMITKEVRVLKILRQMKNLSQDQASFICGYSRPSIGHIENGRITLDLDRIKFIVESYGHKMSEFNRLMCEEILRDEILKSANEKMKNLSEEKLKIVNSLLLNL
ncbi:MAG: helix-turn-helix transcriptional regulator [Bacteriovoracaceae bacterium]|nr:helix-turn-helix transcriptional regulator [Bacteriovoracaceae bacterium]